MKTLTLLAILTGSAAAQPLLEAPTAGSMLDSQGVLREVLGVAGSFVPGSPQVQGVLAFACSQQACIAKTDSRLIAPRGEISAPPGDAMLATDGNRAIAFIPSTGQFVEWRIDARIPATKLLPWNLLAPGDVVLSLRLTEAGTEIAVRRGGATLIVAQDGTVLGGLPDDATGPVLLTDAGTVYASEAGITLERPGADEIRFPLSGVAALFLMSPDWVEIVGGDALYALRVSLGREAIYRLPGGAE